MPMVLALLAVVAGLAFGHIQMEVVAVRRIGFRAKDRAKRLARSRMHAAQEILLVV